jgi:hypothetical protein
VALEFAGIRLTTLPSKFSGVIGRFLNYFLEIVKIVKSLTMPKLFKNAQSQE